MKGKFGNHLGCDRATAKLCASRTSARRFSDSCLSALWPFATMMEPSSKTSDATRSYSAGVRCSSSARIARFANRSSTSWTDAGGFCVGVGFEIPALFHESSRHWPSRAAMGLGSATSATNQSSACGGDARADVRSRCIDLAANRCCPLNHRRPAPADVPASASWCLRTPASARCCFRTAMPMGAHATAASATKRTCAVPWPPSCIVL
mmetsp:Transcript_28186/g.81049  ORF Transcript_28186/g.81049 Transcript_28186/m.81049 type:complete len:208 (+) Transcript_28186:496-1119(+)